MHWVVALRIFHQLQTLPTIKLLTRDCRLLYDFFCFRVNFLSDTSYLHLRYLTFLLTSNFLEGITVNWATHMWTISCESQLIVHMCVAQLTRIMSPSWPKREFPVSILLSFVTVSTSRLRCRFGYVPLSLSPCWIVAVLTFAVLVCRRFDHTPNIHVDRYLDRVFGDFSAAVGPIC